MRYAALSVAVFGASIFMVANNQQSQTMQSSVPAIVSSSSVLSTIKSRPLATLTKAEVAAATPVTTTPEVRPQIAETAAQPVPTEPAILTVAAGDNLSSLAAVAGISYRRLYDANAVVTDPDLIYPGQQLRVPLADEVLTSRELPANAPAAAKAEPVVQATARSSAATTQPSSAPVVADGSVWDRLAACESGGNWAINTGNGYYGGIQFSLATWKSLGGSGLPSDASREEQILRAEMLLARSGWGQWPACTAKLGLR